MKLKLHLLTILLLPIFAFGQSIQFPEVGSSDNSLTTIIKIEVTAKNTVVTFKSFMPASGSWIQLSKGIYLQDAQADRRYNYIRSEGITIAPVKTYAAQNSQQKIFKVYFQKLKPGTKSVNVIERAGPAKELIAGAYFNYYNVNLTKSRITSGIHRTKITDVTLIPPPIDIITDTTSKDSDTEIDVSSAVGATNKRMLLAQQQMYQNMLDNKLKMYADKAVLQKIAKITKDYYDELIKAGFNADAALKIITSNQFIPIGY